MEGWRGIKLSKRSTMEERESAKSWVPIGEEGSLNRFPQKPTVGGAETRRGGTTASVGGTATPRDSASQRLAKETARAVLPPEAAVLPRASNRRQLWRH